MSNPKLRPADLILQILLPVFLLILLPLLLTRILEIRLAVKLDATDRSLIHFFLFLFFFAYLAIVGFKTPLNILRIWHREVEASLSDWVLDRRKRPREQDQVSGEP